MTLENILCLNSRRPEFKHLKKFKYWGYFGILTNGLATLRGLGYILELSAAGALTGAITIAISLTGLRVTLDYKKEIKRT